MGDSAQPLSPEASARPVWLSHSGLSFHILDVRASDCLCLKGSSLGTLRLESLRSSAVYTQLSPGFPRGNHHRILVTLLPGWARVPAGWHWEQSCSLF